MVNGIVETNTGYSSVYKIEGSNSNFKCYGIRPSSGSFFLFFSADLPNTSIEDKFVSIF